MTPALLLAALVAILPAAIPSAASARPAGAAASKAAVEIRYGEWTDAARGGRVAPYKLYLPTGPVIYEGTVEVVLDGRLGGREAFPIRAAYREVQRRAAMHAADVLRRAVLVADDAPLVT